MITPIENKLYILNESNENLKTYKLLYRPVEKTYKEIEDATIIKLGVYIKKYDWGESFAIDDPWLVFLTKLGFLVVRTNCIIEEANMASIILPITISSIAT